MEHHKRQHWRAFSGKAAQHVDVAMLCESLARLCPALKLVSAAGACSEETGGGRESHEEGVGG